MPYCSHCGAEVAASSNFCNRCGNTVVPTLPDKPKPIKVNPFITVVLLVVFVFGGILGEAMRQHDHTAGTLTVMLAFACLFSVICSHLAASKGHHPTGAGIIGFVLGLIGVIYYLAIPRAKPAGS